MSIKGITRTILATEYAEALAKDNDLSGCECVTIGKNVGNWLKETANYIVELSSKVDHHANPHPN